MSTESSSNAELEALCGERADNFLEQRRFSPAHFLLLARIYRRLLRTRIVPLRIDDNHESRHIRGPLDRRTLGLRTPLHSAASILRIPRGDDPLAGSQFSTLRRQDRKATKAGVTCRFVTSPREREALLQMAIDFEKSHPDIRYRREFPRTHDLPEIALWMVAVSADGTPLAISVNPISRNVALLRYLKTISGHPDTRLARYALIAELMRVLSRRWVRYLVDNVSPISVPSALREFAKMTGFRIARVSLRSTSLAD